MLLRSALLALVATDPALEPVSSIDRAHIRAVVRAHVPEVRACYEAGLARDPSLAGKLVLSFTIGTTGRVIASSIASSELADAAVGECIAAAALRWEFYPGALAEIRYPFVFRPVSEVPTTESASSITSDPTATCPSRPCSSTRPAPRS